MRKVFKCINKVIASAIAALLAVSGTVLVSFADDYQKGDVNRSGSINVTDIIIVAAHIKGKRLIDPEYQYLADINEDGIINISDITTIAARVKGYYANKVPEKVNITSTDTSPSYLFLKQNYKGMVKSKELDPNSNNGVLFDNLYYGYQIDDNTYRLYSRNTYTDVPKKYVRDGVFITNKYNNILNVGNISQFDNELNVTEYNGKDKDLSCGPACIAMAVTSEFKKNVSITDVFADGNNYAWSIGTIPKNLYAHNYNYTPWNFEWCEAGGNGTTLNGMFRLMQIYADREGKTAVSPVVNYYESNNKTIDKIDKALSEGHTVVASVLFNSRYVAFNGYSNTIRAVANFLPANPFIHYVVIAGECDGSGKYDGYYAVADPYKKALKDINGNLVCDDINSGLTIVRKQTMAGSINQMYDSWYRGIVYVK